MARHVRKGDTVFVNTGKDKGRTGRVLRVITEQDRVLVEGVNVRAKHMKPTQDNPQGGTIHKEMPIHISNVNPVDGDHKPTRVRFETREDGSKVRVAVTTGKQLGPELKKAKR